MSVPLTLLGLLDSGESHGYTLKRAYDLHFGQERPLKFGQVYATLQRLERDGLAQIVGVEQGPGPDRRLYAITPAGVTRLERWLTEPEPASGFLPTALFSKVVVALLSGRAPEQVLDLQRTEHVGRMRQLTRARREMDLMQLLAADFEVAHLEADLKWIEVAAARVEQLRSGGAG
jgi:DNA-binding PadR family transcriptional regulator